MLTAIVANFGEVVRVKCIVCDTQMLAQEEWLFNCPSCGFSASKLSAGSGRGIGGLESLRRHNFTKLIGRLAKRYTLADKSLFEVGCAEGWFLEEAERNGMNVSAIEPSSPHAEMARSNGFQVKEGFFPADTTGKSQYDFVAFNDVFEHLPDPPGAITRCEELLRPGGVLLLNLPSNDGVMYRIGNMLAKMGKLSTLERLWQKEFPSPHLTYFNSSTLRRFVCEKTNLKHIDTFSLDTIAADGLLQRIHASHPGIKGWVICSALLIALPIFKFLPPDIIVGIFEKPHMS